MLILVSNRIILMNSETVELVAKSVKLVSYLKKKYGRKLLNLKLRLTTKYKVKCRTILEKSRIRARKVLQSSGVTSI
jgi:hypothetical protein